MADGTLRPAPIREPLTLPQGLLAGWPWERDSTVVLVSWALALQWIQGSGPITYSELAPGF